MKKVFLIALLFVLVTFTFAQGAAGSGAILQYGEDDVQAFLGVDAKSAGCFCCVKETCVVARNEADCKKIDGVKIKDCKECEETVDKEKEKKKEK